MGVLAVIAGVLVGCSGSGSGELDPVVGEWTADGAQPAGYDDFGDAASIEVGKDGKATLGTAPMRLCGAAEVTRRKDPGGGGKRFRIAFPQGSQCISVTVPSSLDVTVDGDALTATLTGSAGSPYRFRRSG
ncbi:hypothetical protein [Streptomyces sp. NPDC050145]|uniref:hypothetical protein n=1 Tax=Streptomyces sp. NPDC050145 TaxID=3365602 RepID=UPI0037AD9F73